MMYVHPMFGFVDSYMAAVPKFMMGPALDFLLFLHSDKFYTGVSNRPVVQKRTLCLMSYGTKDYCIHIILMK